MTQNNLTFHQEEKIINLLNIISEQSNLFTKSEPLLIKIPFETLIEANINYAEARNLIYFLNAKVGEIDPVSMWINILNGNITRLEGEVVWQTEEDITPLPGVNLEDDKDSLILEIYRFDLIKKKTESLLNINLSKSGLKSYFEDGEIIVGQNKLKIYKNSEQNDFCEIMFGKPPRSNITFLEIWNKVKGFKEEGEKLNTKELKAIENMVSVLNSSLRKKGIKKRLFSQRRPVVYRNY